MKNTTMSLNIPLLLGILIMTFSQNLLGLNETNIALGKSYTMDPPSRYELSTTDRDPVKLTDGVTTPPSHGPTIWTSKETTVGWQWTVPIVTIDLEQSRSIGGLMFSTAAGRGGVTWPRQIAVFTSDDAKNWTFIGDVAQLSKQPSHLPTDSTATWKYETHGLNGRGRYVAMAIEAAPSKSNARFVFSDEIAVFAGSAEDTKKEDGPIIQGNDGIRALINSRQVLIGMQNRMLSDLDQIDRMARELNDAEVIPVAQFKKEIAEISTPEAGDFKTILPFEGVHTEIWAAYGKLLGNHLPRLSIWKHHRFDQLPILTTPASVPKEVPVLSIEMMRGEFRSDAFLITNASGESVDLSLSVKGASALSPEEGQSWLRVSAVLWTDTAEGEPVADALPGIEPEDQRYPVTIPAGMTRKVWITVDSTDLSPGQHPLVVDLEGEDFERSIPFFLRVSDISMQRPRLSLGVWDYTNGNGSLGLTPRNISSAISLMKSHYVDSPTASKSVLPWPENDDYDGEDQLARPLKFDEFDKWVRLWPEARNYQVFINGGNDFAGSDVGSEMFDRRVAAWAAAIEAHLLLSKIDPKNFVLQIVDEPKTESQDAHFLKWAKAFKAGSSKISLFTNPTWERPDLKPNQRAVEIADILCPYIIRYQQGGPDVATYFERHRQDGKILWSYLCAGPVRTFDPTQYFRAQAWWAFANKAECINFWAFGHIQAPSSWNEYMSTGPAYAPAFVGLDAATNSIRWEAVRESLQDYEYLAMLRDAVATASNDAWEYEADDLLRDGPALVLENAPAETQWRADVAANHPDTVRIEVLRLLEAKNP